MREALIRAALVKSVPADVGKHGAADDEGSDDQGGEYTGPEAHAAEGNEKDAVLASQVDSCLVGQESLHSYCDQKARRPYEGDSEGELKGDVHHRVDGSSLMQRRVSLGTAPFGVDAEDIGLAASQDPALPENVATIQSIKKLNAGPLVCPFVAAPLLRPT